jgi:hypothetical protein
MSFLFNRFNSSVPTRYSEEERKKNGARHNNCSFILYSFSSKGLSPKLLLERRKKKKNSARHFTLYGFSAKGLRPELLQVRRRRRMVQDTTVVSLHLWLLFKVVKARCPARDCEEEEEEAEEWCENQQLFLHSLEYHIR